MDCFDCNGKFSCNASKDNCPLTSSPTPKSGLTGEEIKAKIREQGYWVEEISPETAILLTLKIASVYYSVQLAKQDEKIRRLLELSTSLLKEICRLCVRHMNPQQNCTSCEEMEHWRAIIKELK